ncbi:hypothetical protein DFH06DRAFT_1246058 [Mycena polygramma]|nr:hypothetical protein DFH06DRAFT_1246058 [Mycena polygramma]
MAPVPAGQKLPAQLAEYFDALNLGSETKEPAETKRPNKHTHRVEWNAHFERDIAKHYSPYAFSSELYENSKHLAWSLKFAHIGDLNQHMARITKEIVYHEGELIALALEKIVYGSASFEKDWAALATKEKEELVLEGLYRGACAAPRDNSRNCCPEMTVGGLAGDGEYSLIPLLMRLIEHDPTGNGLVKELFLFSHPYTDHEFRHTEAAPDMVKANLHYAVLLRNYYIVETLRGILDVYDKVPARVIRVAKLYYHPRNEECDEGKREFSAGIKRSGLRVDQSQCKENAAVAEYVCFACFHTKDRSELKECGRCRLVRYCSSECQKKDWKEHKKVCGQTRFDPAFLTPTIPRPAEFIGCPPRVDGYLRTPALWRQIGYLSKPDSQTQDYHINLERDRTRSVRIISLPGTQLIFLVARRRAMASGDPAAANKMLDILRDMWTHGMLNLTPQQIWRQFETEYRVKILDGVGVVGAGRFAAPTQVELDEERAFQDQRLAVATFSQEDDPIVNGMRLPTRAEVEEELAYQRGSSDSHCCGHNQPACGHRRH